MATQFRQGRMVLGALTGVAALLPSLAHAEIIKFEDMRRGTTVTAAHCAAVPNTVWVTAYGRGICMRYYYSEAGGTGQQATIFLNGDKAGTMPGQKIDPEEAKDADTQALERRARAISQDMGQPALVLARMGLDGSSGHHAQRRTNLELKITNAAIDAIKQRHGFTSLNMYGQSGGASLVGAMLSMRNDINCGVPGSGRLLANTDALKRNRSIADPALRTMNPSDGIPTIIRSSRAKIMVVTDPQDERVTREHQDSFVQALRRAGRQVEQFYVTAGDDKHHGVTKFALAVTRECVRGTSREQIARLLEDLPAKTRVAERTHRDRERRPAPTYVAPTPPPPEPPVAPERQAQPQDPPRSSPRQVEPKEPVAAPRQCQWFLPQLGVYLNVPCELTIAAKN